MGLIVFFILVAVAVILIKTTFASVNTSEKVISKRTGEPVSLDDIPEIFVVIDIETTGLSPFEDEIIEIGAIRVHKDSDQHQTYQALIKPTKKITPEITEINAITNEMVEKDGIPLKDALEGLQQFIGDLHVIAYNLDFDKEFINIAAERLGMNKIIKRGRCMLKIARKAWPGLKSYKLTEVARMLGHSTEGMHRALADCLATAYVYMAGAPRVKAKYRGR